VDPARRWVAAGAAAAGLRAAAAAAGRGGATAPLRLGGGRHLSPAAGPRHASRCQGRLHTCVKDAVPRHRGPNVTLLAALTPTGVAAPLVVEGATARPVFAAYVAQALLPRLRPGQVVVLDNLSAPKGERIRRLVEAAGGRLLFWPASSPAFNPMEHAFAKPKAHLRRLAARTSEMNRTGPPDVDAGDAGRKKSEPTPLGLRRDGIFMLKPSQKSTKVSKATPRPAGWILDVGY
jgi:transposase